MPENAIPVHAPAPPFSLRCRVALVLLFAAWTLAGLIGHQPWKPDEAYTFGLIDHILRTGDWVVPTLAGEPFMEKPPLYYLVGALFAKLLAPVLPLHDGARLASALFMGLCFVFIGLAARELGGGKRGWVAAIALLGCIGLPVRAHQAVTDVALLAGFALAFYGLALCLRRPVAGGLWLGIGTGVGFMSKGLIAPGMLGIVALGLPLFPAWRNRDYLASLVVALAALLPWLLAWPLALYLRSPELFGEWLWVNNFGRFLGFADLGPTAPRFYYLKLLPWFAWPALPMAVWGLWVRRADGWSQPAIQLPLAAFIVMLAILVGSHDAREIYALPLLLPLAILAAQATDSLSPRAAALLCRAAAVLFTLLAVLLWLCWSGLEFGLPAGLAHRLDTIQPGYPPGFRPLGFASGLAWCAGWAILLLHARRTRARPLPHGHERSLLHGRNRPLLIWSAGMALAWGLIVSLLMGWIDTGKSYRSMFESMSRALPAHYHCVASRQLGEPQRALLLYYAGIETRRVETSASSASCDLLLTQDLSPSPMPLPGPPWQRIWEGARPGDSNEIYRLYRRVANQQQTPKGYP